MNEKRVRRLLRKLGLTALYPKPRLSEAAPGHKIYPYLLRNVAITRVNQVWSTDITYIRLSARVRLSGSDYGLVQPLRVELGSVGDVGIEFLFGGAGLGFAHGAPGDLQLGPGVAVHQY